MPTTAPAVNHPPRYAYSPAEAAAMLGVCRATVYNLITRGELRFTKIGRATRIPATEVERLAGRHGGDGE